MAQSARTPVLLMEIACAVLLIVLLGRGRSDGGCPGSLAGARWGEFGDAAPLTTPGPFLLGLWRRSGIPLYLTEEQFSGHVLVVGPSRTGKTAGAIAPNLLLRDPTRESVVVLDVKTGPRSLWNVTAGRYAARARLFCP
ncbi:MAG: hypothetical protein E6H02_11345, partial [Bacillati bacterium ANGP1]